MKEATGLVAQVVLLHGVLSIYVNIMLNLQVTKLISLIYIKM